MTATFSPYWNRKRHLQQGWKFLSQLNLLADGQDRMDCVGDLQQSLESPRLQVDTLTIGTHLQMETTYDWSFTLTVTPCFDSYPQQCPKVADRVSRACAIQVFSPRSRALPPAPYVVEGGAGRVCLMKQIGADEVAAFCKERVQIYRAGEAADGDDRLVPDDIRTMSVKFTANGERRRGFRDTVDEFTVTEMEGFPYEPRTCLPYLQAIKSVAESTYGQHLAWRQQSRIPEGSRAVYEDEPLSHILDTAVTYDCLSVPNLACFELVVRCKQLIAEAHS